MLHLFMKVVLLLLLLLLVVASCCWRGMFVAAG
jgi:hypothetical protein